LVFAFKLVVERIGVVGGVSIKRGCFGTNLVDTKRSLGFKLCSVFDEKLDVDDDMLVLSLLFALLLLLFDEVSPFLLPRLSNDVLNEFSTKFK
jgi:hypothetical protein